MDAGAGRRVLSAARQPMSGMLPVPCAGGNGTAKAHGRPSVGLDRTKLDDPGGAYFASKFTTAVKKRSSLSYTSPTASTPSGLSFGTRIRTSWPTAAVISVW